VDLAGDGLYRYDTVLTAWGNTALDAVVLALAVPLLLAAWAQHRRGSPRGSLLLTGALGFLLYVYANYAFGTAYNPLFLVYVATLSAALFALVAAFATADRTALIPAAASPAVPHRFLSRFFLVAAVVTALVWLLPLLTALGRGTAPGRLDLYTAPVTHALDLAVVVPACAITGLLVRRRHPMGYLLAVPLLVTVVLLLPTIVLSTVLQHAAGVSFTAGEVVGPIAGFAVLGVLGCWLLVRLLRSVPADRPVRQLPLVHAPDRRPTGARRAVPVTARGVSARGADRSSALGPSFTREGRDGVHPVG
jgi:hypothetical protein